MSSDKRTLQQQPSRDSDPQQQQQSGRQGGQAGGSQVEGEGSYSAARNYQKDIQEYLQKGDVEADMQNSKPRSDSEAHDMEEAEREGKSHSKGER